MDYIVDDKETLNDFLESGKNYSLVKYPPEGIEFRDREDTVLVENNLIPFLHSGEYQNDLVFGKDKTERIVSLEVKDDKIYLFYVNGYVEERPMTYWILASSKLDKNFTKLKGNQHFKYIRKFKDKETYQKFGAIYKKRGIYRVANDQESAMIYHGITLFKNLQVSDISVLAADIEAEGLKQNEDSKVFLITNTFRDNTGKLTKKHFRVDDYDNDDVAMIADWCKWVVEVDPTVIVGHNFFGYDLPYLQYCYGERNGVDRALPLGKFAEDISFSNYTSNFRVDGNTTWEYKKINVFGRHILDTMFLATKYDIGRNYPSWGLKPIAEYEGLVKEDRQFYDASKIGQNWHDPVEREKIVKYGIDDSDDTIGLYDIMVPSVFYMNQSVPKPLQIMGTSASGSQLNAIMVRAYLSDGYSIPEADPYVEDSDESYVAGGMSYGIPGYYKNVTKWDAKSFYPSTVLAFKIYDAEKDPEAYYYKMVEYFTHKRFEQKAQYKQTKDKYYDDLQAASKIFINSAYGLLGTKGLNFNSYENAQKITRCCRKGLQKAIVWATGLDIDYWWSDYKEKKTSTQDADDYSEIDAIVDPAYSYQNMDRHEYTLVNIDTDALSFCKQDMTPFTKEELNYIHEGINDIMYSEWEDDGYYEKFLVIKAKNYVTVEDGKIKRKGSSLTDSKKEPALRNLLDDIVECILENE